MLEVLEEVDVVEDVQATGAWELGLWVRVLLGGVMGISLAVAIWGLELECVGNRLRFGVLSRDCVFGWGLTPRFVLTLHILISLRQIHLTNKRSPHPKLNPGRPIRTLT